jgi:hypothetical protein
VIVNAKEGDEFSRKTLLQLLPTLRCVTPPIPDLLLWMCPRQKQTRICVRGGKRKMNKLVLAAAAVFVQALPAWAAEEQAVWAKTPPFSLQWMCSSSS